MNVVRKIFSLSLFTTCSFLPAYATFEPVTCKNPFTVEQEITEGNKVVAQVYQQMPVLPDSDAVARYVAQLGAKIVANSPPTPGSEQRWPFNFHVVASPDINAFAVPGGAIFVNLGTIQAAETEAQLAGVIAHETSHVILRHSTCNIAKQRNKGLAYGIAQIGSQILLGNGAAGQIAQAGLGIGQGLDFMHMSRDDEKQADLLGTDILYRAAYDPRALPQFFETIQAKYGAGGAQILSDHPNPGNRMQYVNAEIATLPPRSNPVINTNEFRQMHGLAMNGQTYTAEQVKGGVWKNSGHYASGPGQAARGGYSNGSYGNNNGNNGNNGNSGNGNGNGSPVGAVNTSATALGLGVPLQPFQTDKFTLSYPNTWQRTNSSSPLMIFPQGAGSEQGLAYGALIDTAADVGYVSDANTLSQATGKVIQKLTEQNQGLQQISHINDMTVGGRHAKGIEFRGQSPLQENGNPVSEHDWLVTVTRPDGNLSYIVFVAPERDFARMKPTFTSILNSFRTR